MQASTKPDTPNEDDGESIRLDASHIRAVAGEFRNLGLTKHSSNYSHRRFFTASSFLMSHAISKRAPMVVLEGGPGQGKSTITQYVAQVYRANFLGHFEDVSDLPEHHRLAPFKLPIRVDLRDYASWIDSRKKNAILTETTSLEAFLSEFISRHSGGFEFSVADLHEVLRKSHTLLLLDGFDEVADIALRHAIIDETTLTGTRLLGSSIPFQMVVTSRPTAFQDAPSFDKGKWHHIDLQPLAPEQTSDYLSRWIRAKRLSTTEAESFGTNALRRLTEHHIAELSTNPMQLAILLSLMWQQGESLPEKRTALYRNYVDTFLNREAEKSSLIKSHRELILELHGHVAWKLQSLAEDEGGDGRIGHHDLLSILKEYMIREQYDPLVAENIFSVMRQRVVAIVSRFEGTYEFEVQPLREFFAAMHLYQTAAYSPVGEERAETLPDRFSALSQNPYWFNVTRFYAGFYSKGELSTLADGIDDLINAAENIHTRDPTSLAITLVGDWVFSQSIPALHRVMDNILTRQRLRMLLHGFERSGGHHMSLPDRSGRPLLVKACLDEFQRATASDTRYGLARILSANATTDELYEIWKSSRSSCRDINDWATDGDNFGLFRHNRVSTTEITAILKEPDFIELDSVIFEMNDAIVADDDIYSLALDKILGGGEAYLFADGRRGYRSEMLSTLSVISQHDFYIEFGNTGTIDNWMDFNDLDQDSDKSTIDPQHLAWLSEARAMLVNRSGEDLRSQFEMLINQGISTFGNRWILLRACALWASAAAFKGAIVEPVADEWISKFRACLHGTGTANLWRDIYATADGDECKDVAVAAIIGSAPLNHVASMQSEICGHFEEISPHRLGRVLDIIQELRAFEIDQDIPDDQFSRDLTAKAATALLLRADGEWRLKAWFEHFSPYSGDDLEVRKAQSGLAIELAMLAKLDWQVALARVKENYRMGAIRRPAQWFEMRQRGAEIPRDVASEVLSCPHDYPVFLTAFAEEILKQGYRPRPVAELISA